MSWFDSIPGWVRAAAGSTTIALALIAGIIGAEERYVTTDELAEHNREVNNIMVNTELSYSIARCAKLKEMLRNDINNFQVRMDYDSCVIHREAIRMKLRDKRE
jgi:hypothetical protein